MKLELIINDTNLGVQGLLYESRISRVDYPTPESDFFLYFRKLKRKLVQLIDVHPEILLYIYIICTFHSHQENQFIILRNREANMKKLKTLKIPR